MGILKLAKICAGALVLFFPALFSFFYLSELFYHRYKFDKYFIQESKLMLYITHHFYKYES